MKYLLSTLTTIMVFGILTASPQVFAQTPDGQTPAQETLCDQLKGDGVTKGLYGLCVAFCEAGDYADEASSITPEELATLESSTPSGRILANYNKKKNRANNSADPDMPCILVEEPCPCWNADELAEIADGILSISGDQAARTGCYSTGSIISGGSGTLNMFDVTHLGGGVYDWEQVVVWDFGHLKACQYDYRNSNAMTVFSRLSIQSGTLTEEQHASCVSQAAALWETRTQCVEGNHP